MKTKLFPKSIVGWFFYDWSISVYSTIVTTFIIATYFTEKVAVNTIEGTAAWGDAISIAALIIAIISPVFGSIADFEGRRKPWLALFTALIVIGSAALWFVKPSHHYVFMTLSSVVVGTIGVEVAMVFYNSMLRDLVPKNYIGRMSGWAWGFGYFGGLSGLVICLYVFLHHHGYFLNLNPDSYQQIRITGPFVALWVLIFSLPLFILTPDREKFGVSIFTAIKKGMKQLFTTLRSVHQYKNIFKFLIARMIYIDGLNTVFIFGGIYAAGTFHMSFNEIILFGITMHVASGIGAVGFAWVDDWIGPKVTILMAIFLMVVTGIIMVSTASSLVFWGAGVFLCLGVGPIQSGSRSFMVQVSPKEIVTELFGLYALSGRVTAFIGPWVLGEVTLHFNSQRVGMGTPLIFLFVGGLLLLFVKPPQKAT